MLVIAARRVASNMWAAIIKAIAWRVVRKRIAAWRAKRKLKKG